MLSSRFRPRSRRHWAWLVWVGLLFACAQTAASAHAISHLGQHDGRSRDGGLVHAQCDLCLLGATIGGAAPPSAPAGASLPEHGSEAVVVPLRALHGRAPALAYRSRAPPTASR